MNKDELIPVGKITGAHGIRGEARVLLYGGADEFPYRTILAKAEGGGRGRGAGGPEAGEKGSGSGAAGPPPVPGVLTVEGVRRHKGLFLVLFKGFRTRSEAETLTGVELFVKREDLPGLSPGEFYQHDLIGISVRTEDGRPLGVVTGIIPTGASDVLEIKGPAGELLLPMAGDFIQGVDIDGGEMVVRLLEGMLPGEE